MIVIAIIFGCIIGALIGINAPMIPYTYSTFLAIAVVAALDSVFGGITSVLKKNFDLTIFISGFFCNSHIINSINIFMSKTKYSIYLQALVVFVGRMFTNLTIIRRYYIDLWREKSKNKTIKKKEKQN